MAVIEGITANVIVDGKPLEEFNEGDADDELVADDESDSDYTSSSDDDDQKYVDDKKALQNLVTTSHRSYSGPNRKVTKYIPSVSSAELWSRSAFQPSGYKNSNQRPLILGFLPMENCSAHISGRKRTMTITSRLKK